MKPATDTRAGVLALLIALQDRAGSRVIGEAINLLDREDEHLRVNRVRYYDFAAFKGALLEVVKDKQQRAAVEQVFP